MKLGDLLDKLYRKSPKEIEKRKISEDIYDPTEAKQVEDRFGEVESVIIEGQEEGKLPEKEKTKNRNRLFVISGIVLGALILLGFVFLVFIKFSSKSFDENRIEIAMEGLDKIESPAEINYQLKISNKNLVDLGGVSVTVRFSDAVSAKEADFYAKKGANSLVINVGQINSRKSKEFDLKFDVLSSKREQIYFDVTMQYEPENFSSSFEKKYQKSVDVVPFPVSVNIIPTQQASSGEKVDLDIIVKNDGSKEHSNLVVEIEYPNGFTFESSNPGVEGADKNIWRMDRLNPGEEKHLIVTGTIEGLFENSKNFKAKLYKNENEEKKVLFESEGTVQIVLDRVEIFQEVAKENVYAGDEIFYKIRFKNTSEIPLRDLIITEEINSRILNKAEMEIFDKGHYDSANNQIIWKASDVPELNVLEPNQEGMVTFKAKVKENFPMSNENDKNYSVVSQAAIHSLDVDSPIGYNKQIKSAQGEVKINSKLVLDTSAEYNSDKVENFGPIPMKVEEETTFAVKFEIKNTSNDLKNVVLKATFPSGVVWKNNYKSDDEAGVQFNERTNHLEWVLGTVNAGTGFFNDSKELVFQIGVIPSVNQIDEYVNLVNQIDVEAEDVYTGNKVQYEFGGLASLHVSDIEKKKVE